MAANTARAERDYYDPDHLISIPVAGHTKDGWITSGLLRVIPSQTDMAKLGMDVSDVENLIAPLVQEACQKAFSRLRAKDVYILDPATGKEVSCKTLMRALAYRLDKVFHDLKSDPGIDFILPQTGRYVQNPPVSPEQQQKLAAAETSGNDYALD